MIAAIAPAPVRVLFCEGNTDGTIGGSYYSLLYLVEGLKGTGYQPVVVFHREHGLLARYRECAEVHVMERRRPVHLLTPGSRFRQRHPVLSTPVRLLRRGVNFQGFAATVVQSARFLRSQRVALLHLNNSVTRAHEWMLAALVTRIPCVVHERGINDRFSFFARLLAPRVAAIVCISEAVRRNLLEHRVARHNLRVIENGLDPTRVAPRRTAGSVRQSLGIGDHRRVIGLVGNIKEWKGQEILVRALPAIVARIPDVVCLLVGGVSEADRPYGERLRGLIAELSLQDHIMLTGYSDNVADFLNVMDVAIHASTAPEPFGRVLLEAMALEKPVVGSRSGGVPEIVENGVTGYTFEPGNADELAARVINLLDETAMARAFGQVGRARLIERFSISRNVARTLSLYEEILGGSGGR